MFKWFRKYNKWLLIVGMSLLMIAFLVQGTLDVFRPNQANRPIGIIDGEEVPLSERHVSAMHIKILQSISPIMVADMNDGDAPLRWLLMLREAHQLGLDASNLEVSQVLEALGIQEDGLNTIALSMGVQAEDVLSALRSWITLQQYRELITGFGHLTVDERVMRYQMAQQLWQIGYQSMAMLTLEQAQGQPRLSPPLLKQFLHDQQASVTIKALPIPAARYLDQVSQVDADLVQKLFEENKDKLPGEGEPYGFGYRTPDRMQLEYLALPAHRLREKVDVEEADLLTYYDENPNEFVAPTDPADEETDTEPTILPYTQVRSRILVKLRDRKADELGQQMFKVARAMLLEDARRLETREGYRVIPDDWKPAALRKVAEDLQQQFGILPDVVRHDDRYLDPQQLADLDNIGRSHILGRPDVSFAQYMLSAREVNTDDSVSPLITLRLQEKMPSTPLATDDGSLYLVRIIDAQSARSPKSLDEVREQVEHNARQVQAFELLKKEQQQWLTRARQTSLENLAKETGNSVLTPPPFTHREIQGGGVPEVPLVLGIGTSEVFVDAVFDHVAELAPEGDISEMSQDKRTFIVAVPGKLSAYLVQINDFTPMTRSAFDRIASSPQISVWISQMLIDDLEQDPFSLEALVERVNFRNADGTPYEQGDDADI